MRKSTIISLLLISGFILGMTSCTEKNDPINDLPKMTAKINGSNWEAGLPRGYLMENTLTISGLCAEDPDMFIFLQQMDTGSYDLSDTSLNFATLERNGKIFTTAGDTTTSGNVYISSISMSDSSFSGTFEFVAFNAVDSNYVNVTQGKLSAVVFTRMVPNP